MRMTHTRETVQLFVRDSLLFVRIDLCVVSVSVLMVKGKRGLLLLGGCDNAAGKRQGSSMCVHAFFWLLVSYAQILQLFARRMALHT